MELPKELYVNYHNRRKSDLVRLREAFAANDVEPFRTLGHQLRGNASTYGFDELAVLGEKMESLDSIQLPLQGNSILTAMEQWIQATEIKLANEH